MEKIELWPGQEIVVQQTFDSLESNDTFFVNNSLMGLGKTLITVYAAYLAGYSLFVVSPCYHVWEEMEPLIDIVTILSYEKLRGPGKNKQPKHGYLVQQVEERANGTKSISYAVTEKLIALTGDKKVLLVLDESHKTKNNSLQSRAAAALVQHFRQHGKVAFLSATPFDHIVHIANLFRLLGIMKSRSLCTKSGSLTGLLEIRDYCLTIDEKGTEECLPSYTVALSSQKAQEACLRLYSQVIAPRQVFAMSQKEIFREFGEKKNIKNLFCTIESKEFQEGMHQLKEAVQWEDNLAQMKNKRKGPRRYDAINSALMLLEFAKIPTAIRLIRRDLFLYPHAKIILLCSFRKTIARLCKAFEKWNPLRFEGKMSDKSAEQAKALFQDPSLEHRLFLETCKKGSLGSTYTTRMEKDNDECI